MTDSCALECSYYECDILECSKILGMAYGLKMLLFSISLFSKTVRLGKEGSGLSCDCECLNMDQTVWLLVFQSVGSRPTILT